MLSARAYSFRQKSKLAISLSWIGGYVNTVLFLICGSFVAHMSGNATQLGRSIAALRLSDSLHFALLLLCFWLGAVSSAFMTESAQRRGVRSKYILAMAAEGMLLTILSMLLGISLHGRGADASIANAIAFLGAFTMGLQNATITEISGAVIRTTHLTGVITDFGLEGARFFNWYIDRTRGRRLARIGRVVRLSQRHPTAQRLGLLFCVFWSFIIGAAMGAGMYLHHAPDMLLAPVGFILCIILMDLLKPIAGVRELDLLSDPELRAHGIVKALLPSELGLYRLTHHRHDRSHQPPDFHQWMQHVREQWRVVILAVSPLTYFNENSALALRDVIEKMRANGRELIICGITPTQYRTLIRSGLLEVMDAENLCPDLEFAIARGIDLLKHQPVARAA